MSTHLGATETVPATDAVEPDPQQPAAEAPEVTAEDLLVEEVSIDGMCGVY